MIKTKKRILFYTATLLGIISFLSLLFGSHILTIDELLAGLFNGNSKYHFITWEYRIPRLLIGILSGFALSCSGTIFQGILKNPLASIDVLGITKGAGFMAVLVLTMPIKAYLTVPLAALVGGVGVAVFLLWSSRKNGFESKKIIIMGIAMNALFDAGIQYFTLNNNTDIQTTLTWLVGSLWGKFWNELALLLIFTLSIVPIIMLLSRKLDVLSISDEVAIGIGENVKRTKIILLILAVLLTASSVSIVGTISFIGLIAPHLAKIFVGQRHQLLLPMSGLIGALLIVVSDTIGRTMFAPIEIPVGIITAVVGSPYFIYLLLKK